MTLAKMQVVPCNRIRPCHLARECPNVVAKPAIAEIHDWRRQPFDDNGIPFQEQPQGFAQIPTIYVEDFV